MIFKGIFASSITTLLKGLSRNMFMSAPCTLDGNKDITNGKSGNHYGGWFKSQTYFFDCFSEAILPFISLRHLSIGANEGEGHKRDAKMLEGNRVGAILWSKWLYCLFTLSKTVSNLTLNITNYSKRSKRNWILLLFTSSVKHLVPLSMSRLSMHVTRLCFFTLIRLRNET